MEFSDDEEIDSAIVTDIYANRSLGIQTELIIML